MRRVCKTVGSTNVIVKFESSINIGKLGSGGNSDVVDDCISR